MMKQGIKYSVLFPIFFLFLAGMSSPCPAAENYLWQIGTLDHNNAEFSLAPNQFDRFSDDSFFVIGFSDAKKDWPYVQPGPVDSWAGGKTHTFTILFNTESAPASGKCALKIAMLDTQKQIPPELQIEINGKEFNQKLPPGAGDLSVNGQPSKGKEYSFDVAFDSNLLKNGENIITIKSISGSWFLYDWLGLETPAAVKLAAVASRTFITGYQPVQALIEKDNKLFQPIRMTIHQIGKPSELTVRIPGMKPAKLICSKTQEEVEIPVPAVSKDSDVDVTIESNGKTLSTQKVTLKPVRKMVVYIVPHSHTDIGYTEIQTAIEEKQMKNLETGIEYARKTANYPEGSRFIWNVEVPWAADLYLQRMPEAKQAEFFEAVKKGWVSLNGMYLNELTGLCRPEELLQLFRYSTQLADRCGVTIDSAMISDVPGYTWGTVTAMAQAGIKYFSTAPNYFDRIGDILVQWENKPFYWISPSGKEKVLVWIPYKGYALSHIINQLSSSFVQDYMAKMNDMKYPYDIAYLRWSGHGDNAVPDMTICDFIKEWNSKYSYPKFIISSTSNAFSAFEKKYASQLPQVRGDWTPYWEDGAGSSAIETAMNRASSDRISQAETLWAMKNPAGYPVKEFENAWQKILLYSEHTWGAWCSVSDPENKMTREQWDIKKSYADQADIQTRKLLGTILKNGETPDTSIKQLEVFNTSSWPRTDLVLLSKELSSAGDSVIDDKGKPAASQRLADGSLAFMGSDIPPYSSKRYTVSAGKPTAAGKVTAEGAVLDNGIIRIQVDEKTGGIIDIKLQGIDNNFADTASGYALNEYLYLPGDKLADLKRNDPVKITIKEKGPLVASLLIESGAPGCNSLSREIRLTAGSDYAEIINTVDKKRAAVSSKPGDGQFAQKGGKESLNFAFPFHVKDGIMRLDIPLGVMQPEINQMPSACKNWFTIGRWADVSNQEIGISWAALDAPLVEVGELSAIMLGSQPYPDVWRKHVEPTNKLFSWVMNNHWGTNYRAYQEGPTVFRYALRPHRAFKPESAAKFAIGLSQPLLAAAAAPKKSAKITDAPLVQVDPEEAVVTALKPSDDGKAWIIKLFGASGKDVQAKLTWNTKPETVWLSDTSEKPIQKTNGAIPLPAWGTITLRVDLPK